MRSGWGWVGGGEVTCKSVFSHALLAGVADGSSEGSIYKLVPWVANMGLVFQPHEEVGIRHIKHLQEVVASLVPSHRGG